MKLGIRLTEYEDGPTWAAILLRRVGLRRVSEAFGIGVHSDARLKAYACERERDAKRAAKEALHELYKLDRGAAVRLSARYPGVFS